MAKFDVIELDSNQPFSLDKTLSCGQAPRWFFDNGWWYGIIRESVVKIRQEENELHFTGADAEFIYDYFCLDFNLENVYTRLKGDNYGKEAIEKNYGLRLLNQDAWECLVFQMTVNKIRTKSSSDRITRVSSKLGKEIEFEGKKFFSFPRPQDIVDAGLPALKSCNISYFADNILMASKKVVENPLWENEIYSADYETAVGILTDFKGIKHRVAEWILLFAFKKYEAFPVDAHIRKIFATNYLKNINLGTPKDDKFDDAIKEVARRNFGEYRGYALEYIFCSQD